MPFKTSPKMRLGAEHDLRVARMVAMRLRAIGVRCEVKRYVDSAGSRLNPVNLLVGGQVEVLCRRLGYTPTGKFQDFEHCAANPWAYIQVGSRDIAGLLHHLCAYSAAHLTK